MNCHYWAFHDWNWLLISARLLSSQPSSLSASQIPSTHWVLSTPQLYGRLGPLEADACRRRMRTVGWGRRHHHHHRHHARRWPRPSHDRMNSMAGGESDATWNVGISGRPLDEACSQEACPQRGQRVLCAAPSQRRGCCVMHGFNAGHSWMASTPRPISKGGPKLGT